ncbi:OsmC family protein [Microbacterium immunditiarum]|uniref:Organic hydroperoxide reductase OsmC/OhrA n=1 Tax=Microbacterium immunditiarum TaxID=337480 RepID=A0A7Y9GR92_9MICO|nr:OsmC family protein [Microbacterium immunditiarum]NYE20120.1 organic hydroperoxide reductase OsmC/OhrA [Microbacterium immunditiarum]
MTKHTYRTLTSWAGSTTGPYAAYDRTHEVSAPPADTPLRLSADPAFRGDDRLMNPEQMLVAAASSCQLLSFLAVANRAGIEVVRYVDAAHGAMDLAEQPARIGSIVLAPTVHVAPGTDHAKVIEAAQRAHETCYIANSLRTEVSLDVTVVDAVPSRAVSS